MNPYSIPPLVVAIITISFGFIAIILGKQKKVKFTFFLMTLAVSIWLFGYYRVYLTTDYKIAFWWVRFLYLGVIFIPVTVYHFIISFLNIRRNKEIFLYYVLGAFFFILTQNKNFISGLYRYPWGYYAKAGFLQNIFLIFFFFVMSKIFYHLYINLKIKKKEALSFEVMRIKYLLFSFFISIFATTDFLPNYGIKFYPLGFICIFFYAILTGTSIIRYRLLDINIALTRAGIFAVVYTLVLGVPFWLGFRYGLWHYSTFIMLILATSGPIIFNYLRHRAEGVLLKDQRRYQNTLRQLSATMTLIKDLDRLLKLIVYRVAKAVKVDFACIYLTDDSRNKLIQKSPYTILGFFPDFPVEITFDSALISFIKQKRKPIFSEELSPEIKKEFNFKSGLIIPSFVRGKLLGLLLLGPKSSGAIYTPEDTAVFEVLANQAGLAIENTEFIEESQKTQAQLFAAERMTSMGAMAGGMSHQINNRLHTIVLAASDTIDTLKFIDTSACSKEVKDYLEQLKHALGRIQENAQHGGKIINDFLDFSQPERLQRETKEIDLKEPLERAIEMVKIKSAFSDESIEKDIPEDLPRIQGDFALLQDTFFNLIDNAIDALIRKETAIKNKEIPHPATYEGKVTIRIFKSDSQITIQIQDNGIGMDEETKKRVFAPFFTTKATSIKGTGLGLFVIQKIINAHEGEIKVSSEYGQGTTFKITLPLTQKK